MAAFGRFEDIQAWQKARAVTKRVYEMTAANEFARDFGLRDQLRRASVSAMANIAEGCARHGDKEFANFLSIARASVAEAQSHLYVALDLGYIDKPRFDEAYGQLDEISRMTLSLARHLRKPR